MSGNSKKPMVNDWRTNAREIILSSWRSKQEGNWLKCPYRIQSSHSMRVNNIIKLNLIYPKNIKYKNCISNSPRSLIMDVNTTSVPFKFKNGLKCCHDTGSLTWLQRRLVYEIGHILTQTTHLQQSKTNTVYTWRSNVSLSVHYGKRNLHKNTIYPLWAVGLLHKTTLRFSVHTLGIARTVLLEGTLCGSLKNRKKANKDVLQIKLQLLNK